MKFADAQGATSLAQLRALPADTFIAPKVAMGNAAPPVWPFNDGYVLPEADPNGTGLPHWPAYAPEAHQTMRLGESMAPMPVADPARRAFHEHRLRQ